MCGICGAITTDQQLSLTLVKRMTPTMVHRGPDDEGYLKAGRLALGMRRLSIIDLEAGHQPLFNEDQSVAVVLNGEIYNYRELRDYLWDRGHTFSTRSDSEVIAHAYEEWGADCVYYLKGMFAFAVFDRRNVFGGTDGTLFLARDRLGIKPFYYFYKNGHHDNATDGAPQFLFASEVRTLLASGAVPRKLARSGLQSFLLFGAVGEPETLLEGVQSLPPGHRMTIRLGETISAPQPERYWTITQNAGTNGHASPKAETARGQVRTLLEGSVRRHLLSDVPVGVFLSGGIDSTSLAALASRVVPGIHTFTVAFQENQFNEGATARLTAERFGTNHRELTLTSREMLARLNEAIIALDQPTIDGINSYFVSWATSQAGLKVALSGLGGDEVFGGYSTFHRTPQYQRIATLGGRLPDGLRSAMAAAATGAGEGIAPGDAARKIAALWNEPESLPDAYYFSRALFTPQQVRSLLNGNSAGYGESLWWQWLAESAEASRRMDTFTAVSCMEAQSYLVNMLLRDTDVMSMAHSLEVRVPFLDHELVEYVTRLPEGLKVRKGVPKSLLTDALGDLLPSEVVNQPKRGFTLPWATWLKGPLRQTIDRGLAEFSDALGKLVAVDEARDVWKSHLNGHTSWSRAWGVYVLNEWAKKHL